MAQETGYLKKAGNISVDGTKIHANAGKHSAVSCKRAAELTGETEKEAAELIGKAEETDSKALKEGLTPKIPAVSRMGGLLRCSPMN
jgi:hypothetical protein